MASKHEHIRSGLWLLLCSLLMASSARATQDSIRITINEKNAPYEYVLKKIEDQTGYTFFYSNKEFDGRERLPAINLKDATIGHALSVLLAGKDVVWKVNNNIVTIYRRKHDITPFLPDGRDSVLPAVRGTITTDDGEALFGATVVVKGTTVGTTTNIHGEFSIKTVKAGATVIASFTGYQNQEFIVRPPEVLVIKLKRNIESLDEQVVIAYGTSTRRKLTGSVSRLTSKEIEKQPVSNPLAAMSGRMAGVQITQSSGISGGPFTVQIRGRSSISQSNAPFYIIDGVPFSSTSVSVGIGTIVRGGSPLNNINPSDIESIEVLKDADATAIYGSRGANGVVLITTKKGKAGKTSYDISLYSGIATVSKKLKLLTTPQYLEMRKEAFLNDGITITPSTPSTSDLKWDSTRYTDWQEELLGGTGRITDVQAVISGGSEATQFRIGSGVHRESSVFPGTFSDTKASVYFNINHKSQDKRLSILFSGTYVDDKNRLSSTDFTYAALNLPPNAPKAYNADGSLNWEGSTWNNPYAELLPQYSGTTSNLISNANISYKIFKGLSIKSNFGYTTMRMQEINTLPIAYYDPAFNITSTNTQFADNSIKTWIAEPQLEYKTQYGKLKFSALAGTTFQQSLKEGQTLTGQGYTNDALLKDIKSAGSVTVNNSNYYKYRYNAVFGRINLELSNKYILNITGRRDGSSRFGPGNQFANFGSVGAGWIFSDEKFVKANQRLFSFGKIRSSYGSTGNDPLRDYGFLDLWVSTNNAYLGSKGLYANNLYNPNFAWEINRKFETAIELGFFKDRILLTAAYYKSMSDNQLVGIALPSISGFNLITANINAEVRNTGWEFEAIAHLFESRKVKWDINANFTIPRSKLLKYPDFEKSASAPLQFAIGYPLNVARSYNYIGVNSQSGTYEFSTASGTPSPTPSFITDITNIVNLQPKLYGGLQNRISYTNWTLDFLFQYVNQLGLNYISGFSNAPGRIGNQPEYVMERWRKPGDNSNVQRFTQNTSSDAYRAYSSSYNRGGNKYSEATFIRLKNVSLFYQLPQSVKKKIKTNSARIYLQGQNIFTITDYQGLDPETQSYTSLPILRVLTAGIQLTF